MRLIFLIVLLLFSQISRSQNLTENKNISYWQKQIELNPNQGLNYFNLAVLLQKDNRLKEAVINYNKVIELKSNLTPIALYYKAKAYEAIGATAKAKEIVSLIRLEDVPSQSRQSILAFKNELYSADFQGPAAENEPDQLDLKDETSEEKRISLFLDYSKGSNSNPGSYSDLNSASAGKDMQSQARAGLDFLIDYSTAFDIKLNYYYSNTSYDQQSTLNYAYHDITLPISIYFNSARLKINPEYFLDYYDNTLFSEQKGVTADLSFKADDNYFSLVAQTNQIANKTQAYSYLSGYQNKIQFGFDQRWQSSKATTKIFRSDYRYADTAILVSSYQTLGINLSYTKYISDFDLSSSFVYEYRQYPKASSPPNATARLDFRTFLNLQLGYTFYNYFRIYADGSLNTNSSNFNTTANDKNYKQTLLLLGLAVNY